jgi:DNA-binding NarL/FixJ family response regulator
MSNIKILVIGRHPEIMQTIIRLINNKPEWVGLGALTNDEAISIFRAQECHVVLMGAGVNADETAVLRNLFNTEKPEVPVIQHYGGGSGLLFAEIYQALGISE